MNKLKNLYSQIPLKIVFWLFLIFTVLVILHLILQYLNMVVYQEQHGLIFELSNRFDFDDEVSLPSWYSFIILFLVSASAAFAYLLENSPKKRFAWLVLAILYLLMSIDEAAGLHEFVLQTMHNIYYLDQDPLVSKNAWWLALPFILIAISALGIMVYKALPRRTVSLMAIGIVLFMIGAVAIDALTATVPLQTYANQGLLVALEESLEIIGTLIILYAILMYIEQNHKAKLKQLCKVIKAKP
jgi:hypothetical protein